MNGQVREITRRERGVGNGLLAFDDFYGGLDDWGGAYVGRFGPTVIAGAVDDEVSVGLSASYHIARGLSFNLGVNYEDATVASNGVTLVETDEVKAVASLRFSF